MKAIIEKDEFFTTWSYGKVRIVKDKANKSFYSYEVQKLEGGRWNRVRSFHELAEAKESALWMAEDIEMERMA